MVQSSQVEGGRAAADDVSRWASKAKDHAVAVGAAEQRGQASARRLRAAIGPTNSGDIAWRVLPLGSTDRAALGEIAHAAALPPLPDNDDGGLCRWLLDEARQLVAATKPAFGIRRLFSGHAKRVQAAAAVEKLVARHSWAMGLGAEDSYGRSTSLPKHHKVEPGNALDQELGLAEAMGWSELDTALFGADKFAYLKEPLHRLGGALGQQEALRNAALEAGRAVRVAEVRRILAEMPVERLRDATAGRLNLGVLDKQGFTNVLQVLEAGHQLEMLPGLGPTNATRMAGAAQNLWHTTFEEMPMRIDFKRKGPETTAFLQALIAWDGVHSMLGSANATRAGEVHQILTQVFQKEATHFIIIPEQRTCSDFTDSVAALAEQAASLGSAKGGVPDPWASFMDDPARYFALIEELGFNVEDESKSHADIPAEIIEAARRIELDTRHLNASLRGYQQFAARYAIAQEKVIIGDEMGLGKTVEAIAVLAHLRAKGHHHAIVICPAAVVTNWMREVAAKSHLTPHRLHGQDRDAALRSWRQRGGAAITTFGSLTWLDDELSPALDIGCVVVDEAHYIKNPHAKRSLLTSDLVNRSDRAVLMTGTPMENRIDEFRTLVAYIRPALDTEAAGLSPKRFRRQVAPVYLRRNQEDVLQELPELVEIDETLPLSDEDVRRYLSALDEGNFMALRQAAMLGGQRSTKIQRLLELVEEAKADGRKVIIFSHFLAVLEGVMRALPGEVFGPLTGRVSPARRQELVDRFTAAAPGAVLVAQIVAGGVGLNIQAASVVVICEPQHKPTTEWQAIARARRMGQLNSVQVYRLLSEEGVDQRIAEILQTKSEAFDAFARDSDIAQQAPEAYDISEAELAREVIASERQRLARDPALR